MSDEGREGKGIRDNGPKPLIDGEAVEKRIGDGIGRIIWWPGKSNADSLRAGGGSGQDCNATRHLGLTDVNIAGAIY